MENRVGTSTLAEGASVQTAIDRTLPTIPGISNSDSRQLSTTNSVLILHHKLATWKDCFRDHRSPALGKAVVIIPLIPFFFVSLCFCRLFASLRCVKLNVCQIRKAILIPSDRGKGGLHSTRDVRWTGDSRSLWLEHLTAGLQLPFRLSFPRRYRSLTEMPSEGLRRHGSLINALVFTREPMHVKNLRTL